MIGFEEGGEEEIAPFYDFSQDTFVPLEEGEDANMHDSDFEDIEEGEGEGEGEGEEESDGLDDSNLPRPAVISTDDSELILPSGKRIGHRDYRRYYKQYLKPSHVRRHLYSRLHLLHVILNRIWKRLECWTRMWTWTERLQTRALF